METLDALHELSRLAERHECPHCGHADVVGPFTMDGYRDGVYREDYRWIVCRDCHRSAAVVVLA